MTCVLIRAWHLCLTILYKCNYDCLNADGKPFDKNAKLLKAIMFVFMTNNNMARVWLFINGCSHTNMYQK